jgi:hypothetical protein
MQAFAIIFVGRVPTLDGSRLHNSSDLNVTLVFLYNPC